jgi:hypothetical protein
MVTHTFKFGKKSVIVDNLPPDFKKVVHNEVIAFDGYKIVADHVRVEVKRNNIPVAILFWEGSYQIGDTKVTITFKK